MFMYFGFRFGPGSFLERLEKEFLGSWRRQRTSFLEKRWEFVVCCCAVRVQPSVFLLLWCWRTAEWCVFMPRAKQKAGLSNLFTLSIWLQMSVSDQWTTWLPLPPKVDLSVYLSVCLSSCLWAGYLKKLCMDSDEIWWIGWVYDKIGGQEQANSILLKVRMQIRSVGGIRNVNCSAWRRYVLYQVSFVFHLNFIFWTTQSMNRNTNLQFNRALVLNSVNYTESHPESACAQRWKIMVFNVSASLPAKQNWISFHKGNVLFLKTSWKTQTTVSVKSSGAKDSSSTVVNFWKMCCFFHRI